MVIGIKYRNFTNYNGALADGTCCDTGGTVPNCAPNNCDTTFLPCATLVGGVQCAAFDHSVTATMYNKDSFVLQDTIGNMAFQQTSPSTVLYTTAFYSQDISFNILAREFPGNVPIASFNFTIDWMDTFFSDTHWRPFLLKDTQAELGLDVIRHCANSYFGPTCSVECIPTSKYTCQNDGSKNCTNGYFSPNCSVKCDPTPQYTCLNDGSKNCTNGWQGPDCTDLVPYCTGGLCQNGGTCTNIHLGYFCTCQPLYWGQHCDNKNTTSTALSADMFNRSSSTTGSSSNNNDVTTVVATSVSFGLLLVGILLAAAVYVYMRKKKRQSRGKVQPSSPPTDSRADVQTDEEKTIP